MYNVYYNLYIYTPSPGLGTMKGTICELHGATTLPPLSPIY